MQCDKPNPRLAYIAPLYNQAKDVAWTYLKRLAYPLQGVPNETEEDSVSFTFHVDAEDGEVLMLAHMNEEAFRLTLETGRVHYFSRSRNKLWKKGESSDDELRITFGLTRGSRLDRKSVV